VAHPRVAAVSWRQLNQEFNEMPESASLQTRLQAYALEPVPDGQRRGLFSSIAVFCGWVVTTTPLLVAGVLYIVLELLYERLVARSAESPRLLNP
jgi:hypothetical protein